MFPWTDQEVSPGHCAVAAAVAAGGGLRAANQGALHPGEGQIAQPPQPSAVAGGRQGRGSRHHEKHRTDTDG